MSTFDYPYTCPDINKNIEYIQGSIYNFLEQLIDDYRDNGFNEDTSTTLLSQYLYSDIEQYIEEIRSSNQSIRDAAEKQIQDIENEKRDLEWELEDKNKEIDDLNDKIYDLEKELAAFE